MSYNPQTFPSAKCLTNFQSGYGASRWFTDNFSFCPACTLTRHACSVASDYFWPHGLQPARLLCPWTSPGKNTGVGCLSLSGDFPTRGSHSCPLHLLHWQADCKESAPPWQRPICQTFLRQGIRFHRGLEQGFSATALLISRAGNLLYSDGAGGCLCIQQI